MNEEIINQIAEILGSSGSAAVSAYATWFVVEAATFIALGIGGAIWAIRWKGEGWPFDFDVFSFRVVVVASCVLMAACHVADLVAPEAYAIHQLLEDIRG